MAEAKSIKLMAAAKEFNIGTSTLVEFLGFKGFSVKNSPMEKLSEDMYTALQKEYAADKLAKSKSEDIHLHKAKETAKPEVKEIKIEKIEAPQISITKVDLPKIDLEAEKIPEQSLPTVIESKPKKKTVKKEEILPTENADPVEPVKIKKSTKKVEVLAPVVEEKPIPEKIAIKKTKLEGPNILGKIDLSTIGKPTKGSVPPKQKTETPVTETKTAISTPVEKKVIKTEAEKIKERESNFLNKANLDKAQADKDKTIIDATPTAKTEDDALIENVVERKVLGGLTVLGKINLPSPNTNTGGSNERHKRKRIPLNNTNKPATNTGTGGNTGARPPYNNNRPGTTGNSGGARPPYNNNRTAGNTGGGYKKPEDRVIEESEIQDKIKETLAKMGGTQKGKSSKAKYRRNKREEIAERTAQENENRDDTVLKLTEFISVNEFANLMNVSFAEVIGKCMGLGMMVSINQRLDAEVIELVASEFGFTVEFINLEQEAESEIDEADEDLALQETRAPIVTIMGHVDHGKTSLLDYIRKANVIAGEAGGITQHIGAYEVTLPNGKAITFLDTPGHEAFTAMRARGAKVTDLAVIVVAADDAVMPQTKEAISHSQAANVPMIFAVNKIDRDGANPQKIYEQLSGMNILVEEWGGKFQNQEIAAKTGLNVDLLLEKILLESEILDLKANPNKPAVGTVIEASLDKGRGYVATILVQAGTLRLGDMMVAGSIYGRIKAMYDERGKKMTEAGPSTPVQILGLNGAPQAGEKLKVYIDEDEAKEIATHRAQIMREQGVRTKKHMTLDEIGRRLALGNFKQLNVIIKGDVDGSVEALSDSLQKLSTEEVAVSVVHKAVGQISESDVSLATASDAIILGFQVRPSNQAAQQADKENIEIRYYSVIYDAIDEIRNAMEGMLEPKVEQKRTCNVEVKEVYKITGVGNIAGCQVLDGKLTRQTKINIIRDGIVVHTGELASLKRFKDDAKEVLSGTECGLNIKNFQDLKVGDIIEGFEEIEIKRTL